MNQQNMSQLIVANGKWEALYRKALEDLDNADEMIRRIGNRLYEKQKYQNICSCCFDNIEKVLCTGCYNYQLKDISRSDENVLEPRERARRLVRSTCAETAEMRKELSPQVDIGKAQDRYYTALDKMNEANSYYASVDEFAEIRDDIGPSVDDEDEEVEPAWMNDTTSLWKMPECSALDSIKGYTTPPSSPHVLMSPPKLERSKKMTSVPAMIHPEHCICYKCTYCKK
jgi:hypothetical protein